MKEKIIYGLIIIAFLSFVFSDIVRYNLEPRHKVRIEYVVYTPSGPIVKNECYECAGREFRHSSRSVSSRSSLMAHSIENCHTFFCYINKDAVTFYVGNNDVEVKSLEIIE